MQQSKTPVPKMNEGFTSTRLFHCDALGQVARLIHVISPGDTGVISQKLQGNHRQHRSKEGTYAW